MTGITSNLVKAPQGRTCAPEFKVADAETDGPFAYNHCKQIWISLNSDLTKLIDRSHELFDRDGNFEGSRIDALNLIKDLVAGVRKARHFMAVCGIFVNGQDKTYKRILEIYMDEANRSIGKLIPHAGPGSDLAPILAPLRRLLPHLLPQLN